MAVWTTPFPAFYLPSLIGRSEWSGFGGTDCSVSGDLLERRFRRAMPPIPTCPFASKYDLPWNDRVNFFVARPVPHFRLEDHTQARRLRPGIVSFLEYSNSCQRCMASSYPASQTLKYGVLFPPLFPSPEYPSLSSLIQPFPFSTRSKLCPHISCTS
jgi:hypothetical protein